MNLEHFLAEEKKNYEPDIFYNPGSKFSIHIKQTKKITTLYTLMIS